MSSRIKILPQAVVDKIAAGEVVVRPVNAVKELIENCLDAGATEITISIQKGGLDLIKVQDNGSGILAEDMPIACSRFATSKLKDYGDLEQIGTFGFRGEALASISYVSNVTIISKTRQDKCAHKATFNDGIMSSKLSNSAGLFGTTIIAEKLFYNCASRRQSMKYPHEEANRIADLIVKYAIHYPSVSFAFRRLDNSSSDFRTLGSGNRHQTIQALLHSKNTKDLIDFDFKDENLHFCFEICLSVPISTYTSTAIQSKQNRQKVFHLFINDRLVECPKLKQSLDLLFESKNVMCQFMSISLKIDANRMDVNVHPTKAIVKFLDEDQIVDRIEQKMFEWLKNSQEKGIIELPANNCSNSQNNNNSFNGMDYEDLLNPSSTSRNNSNEEEILSQNSQNRKIFAVNSEITRKRQSNNNLNTEMDSSPSRRRLNQSFINNMAMRSKEGDDSLRKISKHSQPFSQQQHNNDTNKTTNPLGIFSGGGNFTQRVRIDSNTRKLDEFLTAQSPGFSSSASINQPQKLSTDVRLISLNLSTNSFDDSIFPGEKINEEEDIFGEDVIKKNPTILNSNNGNVLTTNESTSMERVFELESLDYLRQEICGAASPEIGNLFKRHNFVGFVGDDFGVIQSDSAAYIFQISALLREFFYQIVIFSFGNMGSYRLDSSTNEMINVYEFLGIYLFGAEETEILNSKSPREKVEQMEKVELLADVLLQNSQLLWDYFSIEICIGKDDDLYLRSIPCILEGYTPSLEQLPQLLFDLASNVAYDEELSCFRGIALALADFFTPITTLEYPSLVDGIGDLETDNEQQIIESARIRLEIRQQMQSLIFPALKCKFLPPKRLANLKNEGVDESGGEKKSTIIQQITSIEQAFKKFGRC